jgi:hypothetical protein
VTHVMDEEYEIAADFAEAAEPSGEALEARIRALIASRDATIREQAQEIAEWKRKAENLCQAYGEHLIEHGAGGRCSQRRSVSQPEIPRNMVSSGVGEIAAARAPEPEGE